MNKAKHVLDGSEEGDESMEQSEERVKIFRELLASVSPIYFTEYDRNFNVLYTNCPDFEMFSIFFALEKVEDDSLFDIEAAEEEIAGAKRALAIFTNGIGMTWISDAEMIDDKIHRIYLLGPVFLDDYTMKQFEPKLNKVNFPMRLKREFLNVIHQLPIISLNRFYEYGIMLHCALTGEKISVSDFIFPYLQHTDQKVEKMIKDCHGVYLAELQFLKLVEEGNLNYMKEKDRIRSIGDGLKLSRNDYMRQAKNTVIVFCTLVSRAAIRGGLPSETAFTLNDYYIQMVEAAENIENVHEINQAMLNDFIKRVHVLNIESGISPQIRESCDYICMHIEDKLNIHALAARLGYSDYYFSNKFKKEVGISVRDFITKQKIERAKQLLLNSNLDILEISNTLGYGSQSYFGDVFRKNVGVSPGEFREKNKGE